MVTPILRNCGKDYVLWLKTAQFKYNMLKKLKSKECYTQMEQLRAMTLFGCETRFLQTYLLIVVTMYVSTLYYVHTQYTFTPKKNFFARTPHKEILNLNYSLNSVSLWIGNTLIDPIGNDKVARIYNKQTAVFPQNGQNILL